MHEGAASYAYKPLQKRTFIQHRQCIRLAVLLPGFKNDPIRIRITRKPVEGSVYPAYEALSYAWGDESNPFRIEVVPETKTSLIHSSRSFSFDITQNLASAIIHLRRQNTTRVLWIDAICLDQKNAEEKGREICKMGDIYAKAKSVLVWLGSGAAEAKIAFEAMLDVARQVQWNPDSKELLPAADCDEEWKGWEKRDAAFKVPFNSTKWNAIEKVLSSDWFSRVWIWQEIGLANHNSAMVHCGSSSIPWKPFCNAIAFFMFRADFGAPGRATDFQKLLKPAGSLAYFRQDRNLLGLLQTTRRCGCKEPSDRIYALLSLTTRPEPNLLARLRPDCTKPAPLVYKDFAEGEIQINRRLDILWCCDATTWSTELPSWVPDWRKPLPYSDLHLGTFGGGRGPLAPPRDDVNPVSSDVLTLDGVICDTVRSCYAVAAMGLEEESGITSTIRKWYRTTFGAYKLPSAEILVGLCHAVTAGHIGDRYPEDYGPVTLEGAKNIIKRSIASTWSTLSYRHTTTSDELAMFNYMRKLLPHRTIFVTKAGRVGLGPSKIQPDDEIVSIIGSMRLIVLRPTESGNFRIVGFCSLHGFMDLEAILGPLPEGYSVQLVEPCEDPWNMRFVRDGMEPSPQDPRLENRYDGWSSNERDMGGSIVWRHASSGNMTLNDPRHTDIEFLVGRGVAVRDICIE